MRSQSIYYSMVQTYRIVCRKKVQCESRSTEADFSRCTVATYFCLTLYAVTKVLIIFFLTERAHVIRGISRREDKMYWFNMVWLSGAFLIGVASLCCESDNHLIFCATDH